MVVNRPFEDTDDLSFDILQSAAPARAPEPIGVTEWGLRFANGETAWTTWKGHNLTTMEGRAGLVRALKGTAVDLGFPEKLFVNQFKLATRYVEYYPQTVTDLEPEDVE
jgi:hypothetical protein